MIVYDNNEKYGMFSAARLWWMFKVHAVCMYVLLVCNKIVITLPCSHDMSQPCHHDFICELDCIIHCIVNES